MYQEHKDDGLMVINAITENDQRTPPSADDLTYWANTYGLTFPVVADAGSTTMWSYATGGGSLGLPFGVLIDRGMVVHDVTFPTHADAIGLLGD